MVGVQRYLAQRRGWGCGGFVAPSPRARAAAPRRHGVPLLLHAAPQQVVRELVRHDDPSRSNTRRHEVEVETSGKSQRDGVGWVSKNAVRRAFGKTSARPRCGCVCQPGRHPESQPTVAPRPRRSVPRSPCPDAVLRTSRGAAAGDARRRALKPQRHRPPTYLSHRPIFRHEARFVCGKRKNKKTRRTPTSAPRGVPRVLLVRASVRPKRTRAIWYRYTHSNSQQSSWWCWKASDGPNRPRTSAPRTTDNSSHNRQHQ